MYSFVGDVRALVAQPRSIQGPRAFNLWRFEAFDASLLTCGAKP
jgi:hypothetical protein